MKSYDQETAEEFLHSIGFVEATNDGILFVEARDKLVRLLVEAFEDGKIAADIRAHRQGEWKSE